NITLGLIALRSTGNTMWTPLFLTHLAQANAELGQFETAGSNIHEAMTTVEVTKERWYEAEIHRVAGEIALLGTAADTVKAEAYFASALKIARKQKAKSWELRAATSMARVLCLQGKQSTARDILVPVYAWFTEGFDTLDLREAELLLDKLAQDQPINATSSL
ncbi:MAG TPA: adenylate cyclase, partial [Roseiarcus sp.]